ncbi:MAG: hypothetical protein RIQ94_2473 [Pseudomonadota bacterium]|jgi:uncharacterized protein (DUF1778 family)
MRLDKAIQQHVAKMPAYLQTEVYDFVLFLEHKQNLVEKQKPRIAINNELITLTVEQQKNFVETLLNPEPPNAKLQKLAKTYQQKTNESI